MNSILLAVMMIGFVSFLAYLAYDTWLDVKSGLKNLLLLEALKNVSKAALVLLDGGGFWFCYDW